MPPRNSWPICVRSFGLILIGMGRRAIPQYAIKHFNMEVFYRTSSGGRRPSPLHLAVIIGADGFEATPPMEGQKVPHLGDGRLSISGAHAAAPIQPRLETNDGGPQCLIPRPPGNAQAARIFARKCDQRKTPRCA